MSIWPFARAEAKPKGSAWQGRAPQPSPSQEAGAGGKNPAGRGVSRRLSKASRRRSAARSPPRQPQKASTTPAYLAVFKESVSTNEKDRQPTEEKENSSPAEKAPPLQAIAPTSPMDIDFTNQRRPSSKGSAEAEKITALPGSRTLATSPHLRPVTQDTAEIPYNWQLRGASHHSLPHQAQQQSRRGKLQRNPSRNKRSAQHDSSLARRRSSKKRKNDPVREEEIRAMSKPVDVPRRGGDNGLLRRESKKAYGPLNRNFERPVSTISLPFEESIHSSMSGDNEPRRFRLSVLDVMSPRPAMRYRDMNKTYTNDTASSNLLRKDSRSHRPTAKPSQTWRPRAEEKDAAVVKARIDSLADDMDSTELRDILERDRKRKEKRREKEAERLQRKLERRAEKQRTKEWLTTQEGEGGDETTQRPVAHTLGTAAAAKELETARATDEEDFHMEDVQTQDPSAGPTRKVSATNSIPAEDIHPALRTPTQQKRAQEVLGEPEIVIPQMPFHGNDDDDGRRDLATPMSGVEMLNETPAINTAYAVSYTAARATSTKRPITPLSPVTSSVYHGDRAKASKLLGADVAGGEYTKSKTILDEATQPKPIAVPVKADTKRRESGNLSASKKKSGFLASLFRGRRASQSSAPPDTSMAESSFSNTSREEMSQRLPPHLVHHASSSTSFRKAGPPLRTQSIFREDLPESPLSPPDSRVQSPVEQGTLNARYVRRQNFIPSTIMSEGSARVGSPDDERPGSPLSGRASHIMAHSLASVDSEASWLSGGRKRSASNVKKHGSFGRSQDFHGSFEELGMSDEEYFRRMNSPRGGPSPSGLTAALTGSRHASSLALREGSGDATPTKEGQVVSHAGASRQPTVHRVNTRHKSSEGLLNTFNSQATAGAVEEIDSDRTPEAEYPTPADTPPEGRSSEETPFQRATSINLGSKGHVRNISAGSAKLLDIPRRSSRGDIVDLASASGTPNPPATPNKSQFKVNEEREE